MRAFIFLFMSVLTLSSFAAPVPAGRVNRRVVALSRTIILSLDEKGTFVKKIPGGYLFRVSAVVDSKMPLVAFSPLARFTQVAVKGGLTYLPTFLIEGLGEVDMESAAQPAVFDFNAAPEKEILRSYAFELPAADINGAGRCRIEIRTPRGLKVYSVIVDPVKETVTLDSRA